MSQKYSGGFITKSPVAPTSSAASGIWTLDQQQQAQKAGTWPSPPIFIEDLFSTYLYTGTGAALTITNGIDLSTNGGLVWQKSRSAAGQNFIFDTARGALQYLSSNSTGASANYGQSLTAFNTNGFNLGFNLSNSGETDVTWTFRKQPKFFDIVTYTGDSTIRAISHNLGSVPGCIIVKRLNFANNWAVYHRATSATPAADVTFLDLTDATYIGSGGGFWGSTAPTSTNFTVNTALNNSGDTYVAYLFAHDAGGFPASGGGSTNGISCGTFTTDGSSNYSVTLGYEPQWVLWKRTNTTGNWQIYDNMRGMGVAGTSFVLYPDVSNAEAGPNSNTAINSTGFSGTIGSASQTYIYIAIRRGPMKPPTVGTSVFVPQVVAESTTGPNYTNTITSNFPVDWVFTTTSASSRRWGSRLAGNAAMQSNSTAAESSFGLQATVFDSNTSAGIVGTLGSAASAYMYAFKRSPSFFDVVCYTGTSVAQALTHNLTVAPEMIIIKARSNAGENWATWNSSFGIDKVIWLNLTNAVASPGAGNVYPALPTSTQFTVGTNAAQNYTGYTYVAYLFATVAGVSKVGSYTGTGAAQTINCGFTAGSRFVLIKRTDSTGDWYVWDSARGIIPSSDPFFFLNSTTAETTGTDYVDTTNVGFDITSTAPAEINANGGTFIFLAIA